MIAAVLDNREMVFVMIEWEPLVGFPDLRPIPPLTSIATLDQLPDTTVLPPSWL